MRINHITEIAFGKIIGRLLWRALGAILISLFAFIALYNLTIAGTFILETEYGVLYGRLIIASLYAAVALITFAVLFVTRNKLHTKDRAPGTPTSPRIMQIVMLVEALVLGYSLARKRVR